MAKRIHAVRNYDNKTISTIFLSLLIIFMIIIPFYRGLFFRKEYIPAVMFISITFAAFTVIKLKDKSHKIINIYLDMPVLLIPAAYLVSLFFAANAKDAFDAFLLYCSYFMLYKLVSALSEENENYKNVFINLIIISSFLLSLTSMLHLSGIINIKGAFIGNKLFGLYQYANTSASVLGVGIILSLNKLINEDNIKTKAVYQMILTALLPTFIFTLSRGGYLVLAVVLFVNFILVGAKAKVKLIMGLIVSFLSSSLFIYKYYSAAVNQLSGIWVQYLISIIISAIFIYIIYVIRSRFNRTFTDRSISTTLIIISIIFIGAAAFLLTAKGSNGYKYVPKDITDRLSDINLSTESVSLRMLFAKDGLKIIKDYPITGAGGGAWRNLYRQYQSIPYDTTEVHNFYVQYGTEVGIIGLVVLAGLLVLLVISLIKSIKTNSQYLYVYFAAMLLFIHSMIDFNLSLPAVGYILWMLIGIISSDKYTPIIKKSPQKYVGVLALVLTMVILFASSSIFYGMKMGNQGAIIYNTDKDEDKTIEFYEKAIKFDKYNGVYRADLAQLLNNKLRDTKDRKYYDDLLEQLSMMRKYEPHNHKYTATICNMYLSLGLLEEASELADKRLYDEPFVVRSYTVKIDVNYQIANYYLKGDKVKEAEPYLLIVVEAEDKLEEINANLEKPLKLSDEYVEKIQDVKRVLDLIKDDKKE